jgi:hypothetical protein
MRVCIVGGTPIIKREHKTPSRHIVRFSNTSGTANLRKLEIEIMKLNDQIVTLGISHILNQGPKI